MAVSPDGARAYATNLNNGTVSVIRIDQAPTISGTAPAGTVGQPYHHAFTVTGRPAPTVTVTAGTLAGGLILSADGILHGTPTTSNRFEFTITASNGVGDDAVLPVVLDVTDTTPPATGSLGSLGSLGSVGSASWTS
ncbi:hypothetical protein [Rhodococcus sp. ACT016]|uniref:hypothetical protein n=1 Tax=Rhodococcus sp. ACT016 TaxID=3134808 RepID=UPI003D290BED